MNADADAPFPLEVILSFPDCERKVLVESATELENTFASGQIRSLRIPNLAREDSSRLEVLSRDVLVRALIEARLGPALNSYLTPCCGEFHLFMEFDS